MDSKEGVGPLVRSFRERFYSLVEQIPEGKVTTYGALAEALGDQRAARAVGKMLNQNPRPIEVPCHRVVKSDGTIGGYAGGEDKKKKLLREEGVKIEGESVRGFKDILFHDFDSDRPLERLREEQLRIKERVEIPEKTENGHDDLQVIGGLDVSYSGTLGFAALSLWNEEDEIETITAKDKVPFPYISTFLSFRELPLLLKVIKKSNIEPDALLVDGNGILHPNKIGLASHLGVEADIPSIGVAKSQLYGRQVNEVDREDQVSEIKENDDLLGYALLKSKSKNAKNPVYVSPGHKISFERSLEIVKRYCTYKVPDPIRNAHILATSTRKEHEAKRNDQKGQR